MTTLKRLAVAGIVVAMILGFALLPCAGPRIRETTARDTSRWRLQEIAIAIHTYYDIHHMLPPAVVRDKDGKPLYSWRVLLLPYLEEKARFDKFKLDEAWDSPHNRTLLEPAPIAYNNHWPEIPPGTTPYQVFTGPGTAFERDGLSLKDDFPDGCSNTILVAEAAELVPWSKPADLFYDPNGPLPPLGYGLSTPVRFLCYNVGHQSGFNACFAGGSSRWFNETTDEKVLRAFITRNGGERVD